MPFYCGACGKECTPMKVDGGIGHYEYWGQKSFDSRPYVGSDCCDADVFTDAALTEPYDIGELVADEAGARADYLYELRKDREMEEREVG